MIICEIRLKTKLNYFKMLTFILSGKGFFLLACLITKFETGFPNSLNISLNLIRFNSPVSFTNKLNVAYIYETDASSFLPQDIKHDVNPH